jgi:hypothetical protein
MPSLYCRPAGRACGDIKAGGDCTPLQGGPEERSSSAWPWRALCTRHPQVKGYISTAQMAHQKGSNPQSSTGNQNAPPCCKNTCVCQC